MGAISSCHARGCRALLAKRAAQRFTVIQAVALAEFDGLHEPNAYGQTPLVGNDPTRPNEDYFRHVDWIVAKANSLGMYVGLLPTWGDKWNQRRGIGPEIFTAANAEIYGEWLGRRYKDAGIIWILGGDRPIENDRISRSSARWRAVSELATAALTSSPSIRPAAKAPRRGSTAKRGSTSTCARTAIHPNSRVGTTRREATTTALLSSRCSMASRSTKTIPSHSMPSNSATRSPPTSGGPLYWDLFTGACGHTYGNHSVWQMWTAQREPINTPLMPWYEAIEQHGAVQMQHGRALLESRPFLTRIPDPEVIVAYRRCRPRVPGADDTHSSRHATESNLRNGLRAGGRPFSVRMGTIAGGTVKAWWFDPRTGASTVIGTFPNGGEREFTPPSKGEMLDWVLVLDDASKNYPEPGTARRLQRGFK